MGLTTMNWQYKSSEVDRLLNTHDLEIAAIDAGMEATVYKVWSTKLDIGFALKLWNKRNPPDVAKQYHLLEKLREMGHSVSKPYAWGRNSKGEFVLLTSYDGKPLPFDLEAGSAQTVAHLLASIHSADVRLLKGLVPQFDDFVNYFFPELSAHTDIAAVLHNIVGDIEIRTDRFIHGDFNLGNILEYEGKFTVIDWTNAQLGDSRYDFAWASFLILLYSGPRCYEAFVKTYTNRIPLDAKEIYNFEMMACLRWIWLSRIAPIPKHKDTVTRLKQFIDHHRELQEVSLMY